MPVIAIVAQEQTETQQKLENKIGEKKLYKYF